MLMPELLHFIESLPRKDKLFYLLMRAYESELSQIPDKSSPIAKVISNIYEREILHLLYSDSRHSVYESQIPRDENAESSHSKMEESKNPEDKTPDIPFKTPVCTDAKIDDPFESKLGQWASSFSDSDSDKN